MAKSGKNSGTATSCGAKCSIDFQPRLFSTLKGYNKERFSKDLMAGIIVGIVAIPLAIAFGIASGVGPTELISEYAFCSCEALETLVLPDEITSIGEGAFDGCENLVLKVKAESTAEEYVLQNDLLYELK